MPLNLLTVGRLSGPHTSREQRDTGHRPKNQAPGTLSLRTATNSNCFKQHQLDVMDTSRVWVCQLRARSRALLGSPSTSAREVTLRHGKEKTYDFWNVGIITEDRDRSVSHTLVDSVYVSKRRSASFQMATSLVVLHLLFSAKKCCLSHGSLLKCRVCSCWRVLISNVATFRGCCPTCCGDTFMATASLPRSLSRP